MCIYFILPDLEMFHRLITDSCKQEDVEEQLTQKPNESTLLGLEAIRLLFPILRDVGEIYLVNEGDSASLMLLESAKNEDEFGFVATVVVPAEDASKTPGCFIKNAARAAAEYWVEDPTRAAVIKRDDAFVHVLAQAGDMEWTRRPVRPGSVQELQQFARDDRDCQISIFIAPAKKQLALM